MLILNLRKVNNVGALYEKKFINFKLFKNKAFIAFLCSFVLGAIIGNICIKYIQEKTIIISAVLLFVAFMLMFVDREKGKETLAI